MKENSRFRNHISIVLEQFGSFFYIILIMAVSGIAQNLDTLKEMDFQFLYASKTLIGAVVCLLVVVLLIGRNLFVWAKTYISIQDNAIVIERNTINKRKHTIGIKNISNINIEQNLFEMLIGTCKVKLDTNSLSTADKTDVKIVLKKKAANQFCEQVTGMLLQQQGTAEKEQHKEAQLEGKENRKKYPKGHTVIHSLREGRLSPDKGYDITTDFGALFVHGVFSIRILSLLITIAGGVGAVAVIVEIVRAPEAVETIVGALASILIAGSVFFSALWDTVKDFIQYYDFRARREKDKIYIRYGFFKKVGYTIPVDKIQALKIHQTWFARIAGRYMVEVVNVGMNDEAGQKAFLVLYSKKEQFKETLHTLLPEFEEAASMETGRQPKAVWAAWILPFGSFAAFTAAVCMACISYKPSYALWILSGETGILVLTLLCMILKYRTAGVGMDEAFLKICRGYMGRRYILIPYSRIQYLETSQNFVARRCGIEKGEVNLLASAGEASQALPYFYAEYTGQIKEKMVANCGQL